MKIKTFYILLLTFLITLFASVGAASWIIISNPQLNNNINERGYIEISPTITISNTAVYEGETITASANVPGTFKYGDTVLGTVSNTAPNTNISISVPTNVSGTSKTIATNITFTPDSNASYLTNNYYKLSSATPITKSVNIKAVAYISNSITSTSGTYYGSVENAINAANQHANNKYVFVYASLSNSGLTVANYKQISALTINNDCTINNGTTLVIPCKEISSTASDDNFAGNTDLSFIKSMTNGTSNSKLNAYDNPTNYLSYNVNINDGVTLTNNGTIFVGGTVTGGGGNCAVSGATSGVYGQLTLGAEANLINNNIIECYGFIDEKTLDNDSSFTNKSGGLLTTPFTVVEHRGGSNFLNMGGGLGGNIGGIIGGFLGGTLEVDLLATPFNRFIMANVVTKFISEYGSQTIGYADLYADEQHNVTHIKIISSSSDSLIALTNQNSKMVSKYNPTTKVNSLNVFGNSTLNPLSLKLTVQGINVLVSTKSVYFPISWYFNITLNPYENERNATVIFNNDIKLLPGSSLTVESGVTLRAQNMVVYDDYDETGADGIASTWTDQLLGSTITYNQYYNTTSNITTLTLGAANLLVNGTLNSVGLAGKVNSKSAGAITSISDTTSLTSYEVTTTASDSASDHQAISPTLSLRASNTTYSSKGAYNSTSSTYSENSTTYNYWTDITTREFTTTFNYVLDDGTPLALSGHNNSNIANFMFNSGTYTLANPTAPVSGYTFAGWYTSPDCTYTSRITEFDCANYIGGVTLYARYTQTPVYTINLIKNNTNNTLSSLAAQYSIIIMEEHLSEFDPSNYDIAYEFESVLSDITKAQYFIGWFKETSSSTIFDASIDLSTWANSSSTINLYAGWNEKLALTINGSSEANTEAITFNETVYLLESQIESTFNTYDIRAKAQDNNTAVNKCFVNWTANGSTIPSISASNFTNKALTITANWGKKATVSVRADATTVTVTKNGTVIANPSNSTGISGKEETVYLVPGDIITITVTYSYETNRTFTINGTSYNSGVQYTVTDDTTILTSSSNDSCFVEGTLITLADGTQKKVEDLTTNDLLLTFNHITGKYEAAYLWFNAHTENSASLYNVLNLQFSDNTTLKIVDDHGLFDLTLNRYVFISEYNYKEYLGHKFLKSKLINGEVVNSEIMLTNAFVKEEYTKIYGPVTVGNLNCVAENILTATPGPNGIDGIYNIFEYGELLKYDKAKMQADIEKYGLFTYEDFAEYMTKEVFESTPIKYFKVAIAKGNMTLEDLLEIFKFLAETKVT